MIVLSDKKKLLLALQNKQIGIVPTDTIYGLVCHYQNWKGLERILVLKKRSFDKPFPLLVASLKQMEQFVVLTPELKQFIKQLQEPTTIILPLKRGVQTFFKTIDQTIAIRLVTWKWLQTLLSQTGPLFATSCNLSTHPPLHSWKQLLLFGQKVDFIFQKKPLTFTPSLIWDWKQKTRIR